VKAALKCPECQEQIKVRQVTGEGVLEFKEVFVQDSADNSIDTLHTVQPVEIIDWTSFKSVFSCPNKHRWTQDWDSAQDQPGKLIPVVDDD